MRKYPEMVVLVGHLQRWKPRDKSQKSVRTVAKGSRTEAAFKQTKKSGTDFEENKY